MRLPKRWVMVIVVAVAVIGPMQTPSMRLSVAQGQSGGEINNAPYIYYYSDDLNAWVIELADGSDRRLLGQGLMPEGTNYVSNASWSPSGKWFTWSSFVTTQSGPSFNPTIESLSTQHLAADMTGKVRFLERNDVWPPPSWSSTEDLLLVEEVKDYQQFPKLFARLLPSRLRHVRYAVEDVEANTKEIVFEREFDEWASYSSAEWLKDGQSILFSYQRSVGSRSDVTFVLRGKDGELTFYRTIADSYAVLPTGVIAHLHNRTLILTDLAYQQNRTIHLDLPDNLKLSMYWNKAGDGVFITGQKLDGLRKNLWWLNLNTRQLQFVTHQISRPSRWYDGDIQLISPTGRYFVYLNESYQLNYFDSLTGQVINLGIQIDDHHIYNYKQFYWTDDDHLVIFPVDKKYLRQVNLIDAAEGIVRILALGIDEMKPLQRSPDGRYLAWVLDGIEILDTHSGVKIVLPPDSRAWNSNWGGYVRWHPSGDWFFADDDGGSTDFGPYFRSVVSADGQIRREIYTDSAINWLPENVNPDELPPLQNLPSPVQSITRDISIWDREVVWSLDGKLLRTGLGIWDVVNERFVENVDFSVFPPTQPPAIWEGLEYVVYSPDTRMVVARFPQPSDYPYPAVYNAETRERLFEVPDWGFQPKALFSPDSRYLVIGYVRKPIKIWDTQTWTLVATLPVSSPAVAFSPDGQYLAVGVSWDVEIWRVSDLIGAGQGAEEN